MFGFIKRLFGGRWLTEEKNASYREGYYAAMGEAADYVEDFRAVVNQGARGRWRWSIRRRSDDSFYASGSVRGFASAVEAIQNVRQLAPWIEAKIGVRKDD